MKKKKIQKKYNSCVLSFNTRTLHCLNGGAVLIIRRVLIEYFHRVSYENHYSAILINRHSSRNLSCGYDKIIKHVISPCFKN